MSNISRRIRKLEEAMREKFEEVKRREEEKSRRMWSFGVTNEFMLEGYPEHTWNSLS